MKPIKILCLSLIAFMGLNTQAYAKKTTVLVYWAVDNDLYEFSIPYLKQFEGLPMGDDLNIVVEYDYPDTRGTKRFHNFKFYEDIGEQNSSSPTTLINFVRHGVEQFPADDYILIISSHGSNWSGVIEDVTSNAYMSLKGFKRAISNINSMLPKGQLDMLIFDACRMSYLETLFMFGTETKWLVASAFDVNGFDHYQPLKAMMERDLSLEETGKLYVKTYPEFPGNREYPEMGASLLEPKEINVLPINRFFSQINGKTDLQKAELLKVSFYTGEKNEDWGFDFVALIKKAGEIFPDLQFEAMMLAQEYASMVHASAVTPGTPIHHGIGLTCAEDLKAYRRFPMASIVPEWIKLCKEWKGQ
ncbi:MAG: hypothetical protein K2P81_12975 [Bacteriovoracaceae bacterium]|nr:hypothetical protein [Bacteriovoracaceae bacterium]